ncbi:unnamed protein product [Zymoseptoria tritici ST99CH_3D1]|nr:unnamed protein product [Zymoseptoria tritici ST99CH_3D1]
MTGGVHGSRAPQHSSFGTRSFRLDTAAFSSAHLVNPSANADTTWRTSPYPSLRVSPTIRLRKEAHSTALRILLSRRHSKSADAPSGCACPMRLPTAQPSASSARSFSRSKFRSISVSMGLAVSYTGWTSLSSKTSTMRPPKRSAKPSTTRPTKLLAKPSSRRNSINARYRAYSESHDQPEE